MTAVCAVLAFYMFISLTSRHDDLISVLISADTHLITESPAFIVPESLIKTNLQCLPVLKKSCSSILF